MDKEQIKKFKDSVLNLMGYQQESELFEEVYLKALIDSFSRIQPKALLEEKIRDAFVRDLETTNPLTKDLIDTQILILNWERWQHISDEEKTRADISFAMSGFEFVIECKRLDHADKLYIEQGLRRFVELKYAAKDNFAGMLGFVIQGEPLKIMNTLRNRVADYHPAPSMPKLINQSCAGHPLSFQSKHHRLNQTEIHLFHLFFDCRS